MPDHPPASDNLRAREEKLEAFSHDLQRLHEITNLLSKAQSFDDLCRQAVICASKELNFPRASIWFASGPGRIRGSFGIAEDGSIRDERDHEREARAVTMRQVLSGEERLRVSHDVPLYDHGGNEVGRGDHAVAGLWDGERIIGALSVDDYGRPGSLIGLREELLLLYAATIGHFCTRKHAEEERLKLETRIREAQKLESLGVLAGGIAHDFNNLLVGILGNADMALDELSPSSDAIQFVQRIQSAAKHAAELTRQLLAYTGKVEVSLAPTELNALITRTQHLLRMSVPARTNLQFALADSPVVIHADRTQIRQVIMNLVMNSAESIGDELGYVRIATGCLECTRDDLGDAIPPEHARDGTFGFIEVTDSGCGMDSETQRRVFEPFFSTKFTGRGLGLAAVLGIVRSHGALIRMCSEPGAGSSFQVLFPASTQTAPEAQSEPRDTEALEIKGNVLIVDDQNSVREVAAHMLRKLGYTVLTAADGQHAVATFRTHCDEIECIILDHTMPGMDGVETLQELKRISNDMRVIVTSGYSLSEVKKKFDDPVVVGFIPKPFNLTQMKTELARVFENPD